jgi:membrane-associated phospholipid phosphatase
MMRERLARLTSNILNPFLITFVVIILLSFKATADTAEALKWASISVALSVLPIFVVVVYLAHIGKLDGIFVNPRHQRHRVYVFASILAIAGCVVLWYFDAPELLTASFTAGLASIIVFMGINFFWKISLHTAFTAASVTVLIMVYGVAAIWTVVLLPPVAWARIEMKQHSPVQVAAGAVLAVVIVGLVYRGFGVVG